MLLLQKDDVTTTTRTTIQQQQQHKKGNLNIYEKGKCIMCIKKPQEEDKNTQKRIKKFTATVRKKTRKEHSKIQKKEPVQNNDYKKRNGRKRSKHTQTLDPPEKSRKKTRKMGSHS